MKKAFGNLLIIFAFFALPYFAQTNEAKKINEFNQSYYAEAIGRMDVLAMTLAEQPNAKAYIIVYSGDKDNPGSSYRYANRLKNYLKRVHRIDEKRVIAIGGGQLENQMTELWIVPEGANPPAQTVFFSRNQISASEPTMFDRYVVKLPREGEWDVWDGSHENEPTRLTRVAEVLRQRKDLRLYIVARSQAVYNYQRTGRKLPDGRQKHIAIRSRKLSDPVGFDLKLASAEKRYLIKELGIEPTRIEAIGNGYNLLEDSEKEITSDRVLSTPHIARTVELWLVPINESKLILKKILQRSIK
jgi:hypothetical protein